MFGEHEITQFCENTHDGALSSKMSGLPAAQTWRFGVANAPPNQYMIRRAVAWRVIRCRGWLDVSMALRRLVALRSVLLIFDEVNLVYISCTYLSAIDTRMKINFGQIWCPEAECSSSCSCTWGLVKNHDFSWFWEILFGPQHHSGTHT